MKAYTDIEQSKMLADILPIESADMAYIWHATSDNLEFRFDDDMPPMVLKDVPISEIVADTLPCWSLAALLDVLPNDTDIVKAEADTENEKYMCTAGVKYDIISTFANNSVDACYELILKLKEMNLL